MSHAQSVHERLKKESEDIDRALTVCMIERNAAAQHALEAIQAYDQQMAEIGMADIEGAMDEHTPQSPSQSQSLAAGDGNTVDHNIQRLMKLTGDEGDGEGGDGYDDDDYEDDYDDDGDEFEEGLRMSMDGLSHSNKAVTTTTTAKEKKKKKKKKKKGTGKMFEVQLKRYVPDVAVKKQMRTKLFDILDQQRQDERDVEGEVFGTQDADEPNDQLISEVCDLLYEKQQEHYDRIMEFVEDYMPQPSGQAWGGDPEYFKMLREMRARVDHNLAKKRLL